MLFDSIESDPNTKKTNPEEKKSWNRSDPDQKRNTKQRKIQRNQERYLKVGRAEEEEERSEREELLKVYSKWHTREGENL